MRPSSSRDSTRRPSRNTVTRWQRANTSSNRCEMNSTAAPSARSVSATLNNRSTSTGESAAVGSSMISTFASLDSALAISTSCCSAIDRPRASRSGSIRTPSRSKISVTSPVHGPVVDAPAAAQRLAADEHVLRDRQIRKQSRLLIDHRDPGLARPGGAAEHNVLPGDDQAADCPAGARPPGSSPASTYRPRSRPPAHAPPRRRGRARRPRAHGHRQTPWSPRATRESASAGPRCDGSDSHCRCVMKRYLT